MTKEASGVFTVCAPSTHSLSDILHKYIHLHWQLVRRQNSHDGSWISPMLLFWRLRLTGTACTTLTKPPRTRGMKALIVNDSCQDESLFHLWEIKTGSTPLETPNSLMCAWVKQSCHVGKKNSCCWAAARIYHHSHVAFFFLEHKVQRSWTTDDTRCDECRKRLGTRKLKSKVPVRVLHTPRYFKQWEAPRTLWRRHGDGPEISPK